MIDFPRASFQSFIFHSGIFSSIVFLRKYGEEVWTRKFLTFVSPAILMARAALLISPALIDDPLADSWTLLFKKNWKINHENFVLFLVFQRKTIEHERKNFLWNLRKYWKRCTLYTKLKFLEFFQTILNVFIFINA